MQHEFLETYTIEQERKSKIQRQKLKEQELEAYHQNRWKRRALLILSLIGNVISFFLKAIGIITAFIFTITASLVIFGFILFMGSGFIIGLVKLVKFAWGA